MLNELAKEVLDINIANGWGDKPHEVGTNLMLIVSELSEAMEADRKGIFAQKDKYYKSKEAFEEYIKDSFEDEIADTIIRCLDLCARRGIDIDFHVRAKLEYNKTRGYHHGGKSY